MHRRQFVRAVGGLSIATATAGCTWFEQETDASATVVENVPPTDPADPDPSVAEADSEAVAIPSTEFEQAGEDEFVVRATVENTSDSAFSDASVQIRLFDANEAEDSLLDNAERDAETDRVPAGETWTVTQRFDGVEIGTIDYYAVTARAVLAS